MSPLTVRAPTSVFVVGPHSILTRNGIIFNDRSASEHYWVDEFTGFESPDLLVSAEQNTEEDGELPAPGFSGGRTMTMTGHIKAGSYTQFLNMARALLDSMLDLVESDLVIRTATGSPYLTHQPMFIRCRPADKPQIDMKLSNKDLTGPLRRNFTIALRASASPMYQSVALHYDSLVPTVISQLGRVYNRTYDLVYKTFLDPSGTPSTAGNQFTIHNDGNWQAKPVIRFRGGMSGISLLNQANGHVLGFKHPILAGDYIDVDVAAGTVRNQVGNNKMPSWKMSSDWLQLVGMRSGSTGNNLLQLSVESFDASAKLEIWWRDTIK